jgi:hypothetical protein
MDNTPKREPKSGHKGMHVPHQYFPKDLGASSKAKFCAPSPSPLVDFDRMRDNGDKMHVLLKMMMKMMMQMMVPVA